MDFRILGPLEVRADGAPVPVGGAKPRALLAILLLRAGEVVSTDRLIDELWGERPPETAAKALQVHVSALRKALGAELIETRAPGYALALGPHELDLDRFRALHDDARAQAASDPARARELLGEALALWRGAPLADFAYEPFAQAELGRLEDLRAAALEDRIESDLALGRHVAVVGELESLIARHPHRERLRAQLMLALYRSGRQAEALDAYQQARAALTGELGIDPGRELRELQQAILRQDPALDHRPAPAAAGPSDFVGRERELAELDAALADALAGRGRLVLVAGEPGIGKSRLADEVLRRAAARGAEVLVGRCWEAGGAPAYWPWIQSLRTHIRETEAAAVRDELGAGGGEIAQMLPELQELFADLPAPPAEPEGARFRLFEAVSAFLCAAARSRPIVLVLDDVHAADEPSLLLLRFLARELKSAPLLVLCAFRDVDPTISPVLGSTLADLAREPHVERISLAGLPEAELAEYIERTTGIEPEPRLVRTIHGETEGNPLFAGEMVQLLAAEQRLDQPDAHLRVPPGVKAVIGQRVAHLSAECRAALVSASVMGREFGIDPLARLARLSRGELLEVLDEAMAERVVAEVPGVPGRLRFGHALIRDTLYDELTAARRLQLHRAAGEALETAYSADLDLHLAELARHFVAAAPTGVEDRAIEYARRAGDRAASQLAFEEAVRLYEMALGLIDEPRSRCELLLALGEAQGRAGDTAACKASFRDAAAIAAAESMTDELVHAALGYGGRLIWDVSRDDDLHVPLLEQALAAIGDVDTPERVRLLARLAGGPLRNVRYPPERRKAAATEALAVARRIGDPATLAYALSGFNSAHHAPDYTSQQVVVATELIDVAREAGELEREAEGREHRALALIELGEVKRGREDLAAIGDLGARLRQPSQQWFGAVYAALFALLEGRFDEAEELVGVARRIGADAEAWNALVTYGLQLWILRREQGRLGEIADLVRRSSHEYATYPIWRCVHAQVAAELGHADEARELLDELAEDDFGKLPFDEEWLVSLGALAEAAVALHDGDRMSGLYRLLLPYSDRVAVSYPEVSTGAVARHLGLLAAGTGRFEEADEHFRNAIRINTRIGARPWAIRAEREHAAMPRA